MVVKNLPWTAEWLARGGYAGHLVRDLSNTHVMIVGGGTLISTGLVWYALPRIVGRPLASDGLAQAAFWFTAAGLAVFYVALVANGIAMTRLVSHGWEYEAAKAHLGKWYKVPTGIGAGVMGLGYWCFAATVVLTVFQARLVKVAKPAGHLWKFVVTGALALTVGTVQGVIQVQPAKADWLYRAGHAGEWIDPISHAHINLVTGLTMLVAAVLFFLAPRYGGVAPSPRAANRVFGLLLGASLAFYGTCLYLGFHEGSLVVGRGLTPAQAEEATPLHPWLLMGSGIAMLAAFWLLLATIVRAYRGARMPVRGFVLAGCAALAVGTLQGPIQAFPAVNELLDRGGDAGDVIVNLHAQLNMLGGLMIMLVGLALAVLGAPERRLVRVATPVGIGCYYVAGIALAAVQAHRVEHGQSFAAAVAGLEPWSALLLVPASLAVLAGFGSYALAAWRLTACRATRGTQSAQGRSRPVHGHDSDARSAAEPGLNRCVRAAPRDHGLPRPRLALRGLPGHRVAAADRRPGARLGGDPDGVQPVRRRASARCRLEDRARLAARDDAPVGGAALPRARAAAPRSKVGLRAAGAAAAPTGPASASLSARSRSCSCRSPSCPRSPGSARAPSATATSPG